MLVSPRKKLTGGSVGSLIYQAVCVELVVVTQSVKIGTPQNE